MANNWNRLNSTVRQSKLKCGLGWTFVSHKNKTWTMWRNLPRLRDPARGGSSHRSGRVLAPGRCRSSPGCSPSFAPSATHITTFVNVTSKFIESYKRHPEADFNKWVCIIDKNSRACFRRNREKVWSRWDTWPVHSQSESQPSATKDDWRTTN